MNFKLRHATRGAATALAALVFAAALARPCAAQLDQWGYWENGVTESWWLSSDDFTKEDAVNAVARWRSIGEDKEGAAGEGEWAGDYFSGSETHGTYVRWSPRAGFIVADVDKCQARVMGLTIGRVEVTPTLVRFVPEFKKKARHGHGHAHAPGAQGAPAVMQFVPVRWRGDRLLVAEERMNDFGDYLAGLGKYNHWDFLYSWYIEFFVRRGGGEGGAEAEGGTAPVVPPGYERYLKKPIEATVTEVGRRRVRRDYTYENPDGTGASYERASVTAVTVDAGTAHSVKDGMTFRVAEPAEGDQVKITRAGKFSSAGIVIRSLDDDGAETFYDHKLEDTRRNSRVARGWKLTTSPF